MVKMYYESDASLDYLKGKKIAVLGFGSQGHAQALNLKESGLDVVVGLREGSARWKKAVEFGFEVMTVDKACEAADVIQMLLPDEAQAKVYKEQIAPYIDRKSVV